MTAVMRRLACLLFVLIAIPAARADLQPLASAAYEYRSGLYNLRATDLSGDEARAELEELMSGPDQAAAETLAESMVPAGYEGFGLWMSLADIKSRLGKGLQASYAAYLATENATDSGQKAQGFLALGKALEGINRGSEALEAYDEAIRLTQDPDARAAYTRLSRAIPFHYEMFEISTEGDRPEVCLEFDRRVLGTRQLSYDDYVRVEPETQVAFRANGRALCLDGMSYGASYQVTLKSGLPGESGALEKDEIVEVAIGDREPSVGFQ